MQDVEKLLHRDLAPAYIDERSHHGSYHVTEEAVGGDLEIPGGRRGLDPSGCGNVADGGLVVTASLAESRIVFVMQEMLRRLVHLFEIQRVVHLQRIVALEGILACMDIIMIGTRGGREAGMHLGIYLPNFIDGNVAWQDSVQTIHQLVEGHRDSFFRNFLFRIPVKMRRHVSGMHTGIGSSCTHHLYLLSEKDGKGTLQLLLHRIGIGLNLPAVIVGSVVTKEYKISHCFSLKTTAKLLKKREIWYNNTEYFQKWYNLERKLRFYFAIC